MNQLLKEWEEEQAIKTEMQDIASQYKKLYPPKIPQDLTSPIFNRERPPPKTIGPGIPFINPLESPTIQAGKDVDRRMLEAQSPMEAFKIAQEHPMMGFGPADILPFTFGAAVKGYHGSPYKFEKFMDEKIGTGEGAQTFGYGHYFAGRKEVAEFYKNKLSKYSYPSIEALEEYFKPGRIIPSFGGMDRVRKFNKHIDDEGRVDWSVEVEEVYKEEPDAEWETDTTVRPRIHHTVPGYENLEKVLKTEGKQKLLPGKLYKVELTPDDDEFLLWDKPLSEQSEKVKKALKIIGVRDTNVTGEKLYRRLEHKLQSRKQPSEVLLASGVKGIKYLEGASRNRPKQKERLLKDLDMEINHYKKMIEINEGAILENRASKLKSTYKDYEKDLLSDINSFKSKLESALQKKIDIEQDKDIDYNYVIFDPEHIKIEDVE